MEDPGLTASNAIYYAVFIGVYQRRHDGRLRQARRSARPGPLLLAFFARMGVSIGLLGVAFAADLSPVITLVFMLLYLLAFAIGIGPVFWVLLGEIFRPPNARRDPARARP